MSAAAVWRVLAQLQDYSAVIDYFSLFVIHFLITPTNSPMKFLELVTFFFEIESSKCIKVNVFTTRSLSLIFLF